MLRATRMRVKPAWLSGAPTPAPHRLEPWLYDAYVARYCNETWIRATQGCAWGDAVTWLWGSFIGEHGVDAAAVKEWVN